MTNLMPGTRAIRRAALSAALLAAASAFAADRGVLIAMGVAVEPPTMFKRAIAKPAADPPGKQTELADGDFKALLFVPPAFQLPVDGRIDLAVHFHTEPWFAIEEHLRRGLTGPLLIVTVGQGSSAYARPFRDADRFGRLLDLVAAQLTPQADRPAIVARVDVTSFSAGYGAVREILKQERYVERIRRVILLDSLYASWDPASTQPGATSRPLPENMLPFARFVELAAEGRKTFVLTHSSVQTPYANTQATADWVAAHVGARWADVPVGAAPASRDPDFPLYRRADLGHLHLWGYGGDGPQAHLTHVRHLADVWKALDAAGDGR